MFTGIVEAIGIVANVKEESANRRISIRSPFAQELKIDQSVSHNGACLTVTAVNGDEYEIVAIEETLSRTNLNKLKAGDELNLERSLKIGDRLDGHFVLGHVDETALCNSLEERNGSWLVTFEYGHASGNMLVEKGSVCVNGISLTVVSTGGNKFSVAIIPYTFEHTNFHSLKPGDVVNLEFDVIGKYITRLVGERNGSY